MNDDEMRQFALEKAIQMTRQWRSVDDLVSQGKLTPQSGAWYELSDSKALKNISSIVNEIETNTGSHLPPRVKLTKPDQKLMAMADANTN